MSAGVVAFGPGRVNLLGEHTDYNDGLCLPFAIELGVTVRGWPRAAAGVEVLAADLGESDVFEPGGMRSGSDGGWRAFVRGAAGVLAAEGYQVGGAHLEVSGDVPRGAGLASSAALEVAVVLALLALNGHAEPDRRLLAGWCARVENDWVGAETGLMDQLAALFGRPGHALRLDMATGALRPVPLELGEWTLAAIDSGVRHRHAGSAYNDRRAECREACRRLGVRSLREVDDRPGGVGGSAAALPAVLARRVRHVVEENRRVDRAVAALAAGDVAALGPLLDASHASLRDLYEVSVPEVEETVARARAAGAAGARLVGGGFGGCVLALFPPGAPPPAGSVAVSPGPAARLLAPRC